LKSPQKSKALELRAEGLFTEKLEYLCPSGATPDRLERIKSLFATWTAENPSGPVHSGYRRQILAREGLGSSKMLAQKLRERFDSMLVLGIGGSALGVKTGLSALSWAVPQGERRKVLVAENIDPLDFETLWAQLRPESTCFVVISKSGGTIETISQLAVVLERLKAAGLDPSQHVVAVTDPTKGSLRAWAADEGVQTLDVPSDVGGRFSVLTPVGLLPLAFAGLDVESLVESAARQFEGLGLPLDSLAKVALRLTELERSGLVGHVLMPYATSLREFGDWFVQLWGESLGKIRAEGGAVGPIPIAALGATDQHSLLQLLVEGPRQIITGFLRVENWPSFGPRSPAVHKLPQHFASLSFAVGRSFGEILNAEMVATKRVLEDRGRPVYEIVLDQLSPESLGALFAVYMDLVTLAAAAYEVNPFDQPGVEFGKKILPEILA